MAKFIIRFHDVCFELEGEEDWVTKKIEEKLPKVVGGLLVAEGHFLGAEVSKEILKILK